MNPIYAVTRKLKTGRSAMSRLLALAVLACCMTLSQTAHSQPGCASASIAYSSATYCASAGNEMAVLTGTPGGTFSSSSGLVINASTGTVNATTSTPGAYTIHYTIPAAGACPMVDATTTLTIMERPVVNPVANLAVCAGSTVNVAGFTSSLGGVTYTWTNDNPSIGLASSGTGNIASFTGTNGTDDPKSANIRVYATSTSNGVSCTSKPMSFRIFVNPVPEVDAIPNTTVCNGQSVPSYTFTGPTTGNGVRFIWTSDNTSIGMAHSGVDMIPAFTAINNGAVAQTATVAVTPYYINGARCSGTPRTYTITVNPSAPGTANFSYTGSPYCAVGSVPATFADPGNIPANGTFTSTAGLSLNPNSGAVNTSLSTPGTYTVYFRYDNGAGTCQAQNSATITINESGASISYASASYCNNTVSNLFPTITGATGGTFSASGLPGNLDINPATGAINLNNSVAGNYNVSYQVNTPSCGNVTVGTTINIVNRPIVAPKPNQVVCAGSPVPAMNFIATDMFGAAEPGASFSWTVSDPSIGVAASGNGDMATFTAQNNTNAPIRAIVRVTPRLTKNGITCVGKTMAFQITVNPTYEVTPVGNQVYCASDNATTPINFTNSSGSNVGVSYAWTNSSTITGLGLNGSGNIPSFNPTEGTSTVGVRSTNSYGCTSGVMAFNFMVNNCGSRPIFTPEGSGTQRQSNGAAINQEPVSNNTAYDMAVAPNPVRGNLTVSFSGKNSVTLRVLNLNGTVLKTVRGFNNNGSIDLSSLQPGNYMLQLIDERKNITVQRNIIKL
jgi:hypothetical protein